MRPYKDKGPFTGETSESYYFDKIIVMNLHSLSVLALHDVIKTWIRLHSRRP